MMKRNMNKKIRLHENFGEPHGMVRCILENVITGKKRIYTYRNLITTAGRVALARRLGYTNLYSHEGAITYGAVGTDNTAPTIGDTTLGTEIERVTINQTTYSSNIVTIRTYFSTAEGNGALKEFGLFGEAATGVADTGTLFEHAAIDIVKAVTDTLTVEVLITV